jgi:hypothetical protein
VNIPDEAVEAAAKAMALADGFTELDWAMVPRRYSQRFYDLAKAAAPHIMAQAWEECADGYVDQLANITLEWEELPNPYRQENQ